jgi:DnaK suppressor protein
MTEQHTRALLISERERLQGTMEGIQEGGDVVEQSGAGSVAEVPVDGSHLSDAGSETLAQEMDYALLEQVRSDLDDVDRALRRLDEGTYGRCEACGEPIGEDRLAALPAARYCVEHQRAAEAGDQPVAQLGQL